MELMRVPYALDASGAVVTAVTAAGSRFTCLECGGVVSRRRGERRRWHFFHLPGAGCSGESVQHLAAKRALREQIEAELAEHGSIEWVRRCPGVRGACRDDSLITTRHPVSGWTAVREEVRWNGYVLDVAVKLTPFRGRSDYAAIAATWLCNSNPMGLA